MLFFSSNMVTKEGRIPWSVLSDLPVDRRLNPEHVDRERGNKEKLNPELVIILTQHEGKYVLNAFTRSESHRFNIFGLREMPLCSYTPHGSDELERILPGENVPDDLTWSTLTIDKMGTGYGDPGLDQFRKVIADILQKAEGFNVDGTHSSFLQFTNDPRERVSFYDDILDLHPAHGDVVRTDFLKDLLLKKVGAGNLEYQMRKARSAYF
jgi:hypothetical protein